MPAKSWRWLRTSKIDLQEVGAHQLASEHTRYDRRRIARRGWRRPCASAIGRPCRTQTAVRRLVRPSDVDDTVGRGPLLANRPALTHGRPYRGFGRFPLSDIGEQAKRASESRRANAAYVGKRSPSRLGDPDADNLPLRGKRTGNTEGPSLAASPPQCHRTAHFLPDRLAAASRNGVNG